MLSGSDLTTEWRDPTGIIREIGARRGVTCSAEEFHSAVNVTFHEFESEVYDHEHQDMWRSLPRQFELLVEDYLERQPDLPTTIRMLDIGCGTGLATDCILKTRLGERIRTIELLDTSPSMLGRAARRAAGWKASVTCHEGSLSGLDGERRFDLIVTSSVLHHVPDLSAFLQTVRRFQAPGGIFLHIQDPNGDFLNDPELKERMSQGPKRVLPEWVGRLSPWRIGRRIYRELIGQKGDAYIWKTNRALLERGIISKPLTVQELFAITDIHTDVGDGAGVSLTRMRGWMPEYDCVAQRSYAFFGELWSKLSPARRTIEERLIASRAPNGTHMGAIWKLREVSGSLHDSASS